MGGYSDGTPVGVIELTSSGDKRQTCLLPRY